MKKLKLFNCFIKKVDPEEPLARFLTSKKHFKSSTHEPLPSAFMPKPYTELSVFRIIDMEINEIWEMARKRVINKMKQKRNLYGMAIIKTHIVESNMLKVKPTIWPPKHVNIIDWPLEEHLQLSIAVELAAEAELQLINDN